MRITVKKIPSIVAFLAVNIYLLVTLVMRLTNVDTLTSFTVVCLISVAGLYLVNMTVVFGTRLQKALLLIPLTLGIAGLISFQVIVGQEPTIYDYEKLLFAAGNIISLLKYKSYLFLSFGTVAIVTTIALYHFPKYKIGRILGWKQFSFFYLVPVLAISFILMVRQGYGDKGLPIFYRLPAYFLTLHVEPYLDEFTKAPLKTPVFNLEGAESSKILPPKNNIVLIIDESIRGDFLDLGSAAGIHTGLLSHKNKDFVFSYGIGASASNCSFSTNLVLRLGLRATSYMQELQTHETIWTLAKRAGYRTIFIDSQAGHEGLENRKHDVKDVDITYDASAIELNLSDGWAGDVLLSALEKSKDDGPVFVIMNKVGAHFPAQEKHPESFSPYTPTLEQNLYTMPDDKSLRTNAMTSDYWSRAINSYKNAIEWNVVEFFKKFDLETDLKNTIMVYTSDHGQNFHEDGQKGYSTHCNRPAAVNEGKVPMVAFTGDKYWQSVFKAASKDRRGYASHFQVYPTLLQVMGYSQTSLEEYYESSLLWGEKEKPKFMQLFWTRFATKAEWVPIN